MCVFPCKCCFPRVVVRNNEVASRHLYSSFFFLTLRLSTHHVCKKLNVYFSRITLDWLAFCRSRWTFPVVEVFVPGGTRCTSHLCVSALSGMPCPRWACLPSQLVSLGLSAILSSSFSRILCPPPWVCLPVCLLFCRMLCLGLSPVLSPSLFLLSKFHARSLQLFGAYGGVISSGLLILIHRIWL